MSVEDNRRKNKKTLKIVGAVLLGLFLIGSIVPPAEETKTDTRPVAAEQSFDKSKYIGKEALVVVDELAKEGNSIKVRLLISTVDGRVTTDKDITSELLGDPNSCMKRLETDAYRVDEITKNGNKVDITSFGKGDSYGQTCPAGTINDTNGIVPVAQTPPEPVNNSPSSGVSDVVTDYCNDGTVVTGSPSKRGAANACYGRGGWKNY